MLSRVADAIYWMSRYVERAENTARFAHVNFTLLLDYPGQSDRRQWLPLVETSGDQENFNQYYDSADEANVIRFLSFDDKNPNSIISSIYSARENGRSIRDTISSDMWEHLNNFYLMVRSHRLESELHNMNYFYTQVKKQGQLFIGLSEATMSHGEAWNFAKIGRMLERADKTARILDMKNFMSTIENSESINGGQDSNPYDSILLGAILKSASALEMYRKHCHRMSYKDVASFLIGNRHFPRSLHYCVQKTKESMGDIAKDMPTPPTAAQDSISALEKLVASSEGREIDAHRVHDFINDFQIALNHTGRAISESFFAPT